MLTMAQAPRMRGPPGTKIATDRSAGPKSDIFALVPRSVKYTLPISFVANPTSDRPKSVLVKNRQIASTKTKGRLRGTHTRLATASEADALASLINTAFVVERPIFGGDRTSSARVGELLQREKFLVLEDSEGRAGCVYVEAHGDRGYIGLLSVEPARQGRGLGRKLMDAAEEFCRKAGCVAVDLRVISARVELPALYRHLGYLQTGASELPADVHPKVPSHYIHMSKKLV